MQDGQQPNEPGWVFRPGDAAASAPDDSQPSPAQPSPPAEEEAEPQPAVPAPVQQEAPAPAQAVQLDTDAPQIEWTASEYIADPKSAGWFMLLGFASLILSVVVYIVTRDVISTGVTVVVGIIFGVFAARQPRTLQYRIDNHGLSIGEKFYPYGSFKSFSIAHEHAFGFISLLPLKRFMPPLSIHYAPDDEDAIVQTLAEYLPYEEHKPDMVESFSRRIRF